MVLAAGSLTCSHLRCGTYADDRSVQLRRKPGTKALSIRTPAPFGEARLARFESVRANPSHT